MSAANNQDAAPTIAVPGYFSALAATYTRQTGNTTRSMFAKVLPELQSLSPITSTSIVHDNAAGPGTATSVLVEAITPASSLPTILVTDNAPPMITAATDTFSEKFPSVSAKVMDSQNLSGVPSDHFTHTILNFSIFNMADPAACLSEIHRTLKPGGAAALLTWRRFAVGHIVPAAQGKVRPDLPRMPTVGAQFLQEGYLVERAVEAGFAKEGMRVLSHELVVKEGTEAFRGLKGFALSDFMKPARKGWSEEDEKEWPAAVEEAFKEEVREHGGVRFESWVVLARK